MTDMSLYNRIRSDLIKTMKQSVDLAPDGTVAKERVAEIITAMIDVTAIALVPFPAEAQVATVMALIDRLEKETKRFDSLVAKATAEEVISRAAN